MDSQQELLSIPDDWENRREELIDEILRRWEIAWEKGDDPSPQEICPDCPKSLSAEAAVGIQLLKQFESNFGDGQFPNTYDAKGFRSRSYEGIALVEEGGQGVVIRAADRSLGRDVAIKIPRSMGTMSQLAYARLEREARLTGLLEHPGIIPVHGFGHDNDGVPYYAMRYVPCEKTLSDSIAAVRRLRGKPDHRVAFQRVLRDFVTVCRTIDYAHSKRIIHRDLKPANILVGEFGEVFVTDFGIAKSLDSTESAAQPAAPIANSGDTLVGSETVGPMGTPAYMSPEQALNAADVGPQSDIFSLGATLFHILAGRPAQSRQWSRTEIDRDGNPQSAAIDGALAASVSHANPRQDDATVPRALAEICMKATRINPDSRYATAGELADDIENWLADEPVTAWREPLTERGRRWMKRHRTLVTGAAAAVVVATATLSVSATQLAIQKGRLQRANSTLTRQKSELLQADATSRFLLAKGYAQAGDAERAEMFLNSVAPERQGIAWHELHQVVKRPRTLYASRKVADGRISGSKPPNASAAIGSESADAIDVSRDEQYLAVLIKGRRTIAGHTISVPTWTVRIHDLASGKLLRNIEGSGWARQIRFSAAGHRLAVLIEPVPDKQMENIIQSELRKAQAEAARLRADITSLPRNLRRLPDIFVTNPNETLPPVATGPSDNANELPDNLKISIWDAASGSPLGALDRAAFEREFERVWSPAIRRDQEKNRPDRVTITAPGHVGETVIRHGPWLGLVAVDTKSKLDATFGGDRMIRFWRHDTGQEVGVLTARAAHLRYLRFLSERGEIIWLSGDGVVRIAAVPTGPGRSVVPSPFASGSALAVRVDTVAGRVVTLHRDGLARIWDSADWKLLRELRFHKGKVEAKLLKARKQIDARITPDGSRLAIAGPTGLIVFDRQSGQELYQIQDVCGPITFSRDGTRMGVTRRAENDHDAGPVVIELSTGKTVAAIEPGSSSASDNTSAIHPDGKYVAWSEPNRARITIWKLDTREMLATLDTAPWHGDHGPQSCYFDPSGKNLLTVGQHVIHVWDTVDWKVRASINVPDAEILDVVTSANGYRVLTVSTNAVRLWDTNTGTSLWTFTDPHGGSFRTATLSRDGLRLTAIGDNIVIWDSSEE